MMLKPSEKAECTQCGVIRNVNDSDTGDQSALL